MIAFLFIVLFIVTAGMGVLFWFLNKRVEKYDELISAITEAQQTLRNNQSLLSIDIKKLNNELQITKKGIVKKEVVVRRPPRK